MASEWFIGGVSHDDSTWERCFNHVREWLPYALLGISTLLSQLSPDLSRDERLTVLGLAALAAVWTLLFYTRFAEPRRQHTVMMPIYFIGLLILDTLLLQQSAFFIAIVAVNFSQAFQVLPMALAFLADAVTSCLLYVAPRGANWNLPDGLPLLIFIISFQVIAIGGASYVSIRIARESEKRRKLVAALEVALQENAGLHSQLLTQAREAGMLDERQRLAREIHDTLAQGLAGIVTQLEAADQSRRHDDDWQRHVTAARTLARESLAEARRSVQALRPEPLEGTRLADAIAEMAARWSATAGTTAQVETTGEPVPLLAELEVTLFRVAQEALTNAGKHAGASRVGLTLSYMDDVVLLDVRDDGAGFAVEALPEGGHAHLPGHGFGLMGMRQRLRLVGGTLEIESAPGTGTAISASVPALAAEGTA